MSPNFYDLINYEAQIGTTVIMKLKYSKVFLFSSIYGGLKFAQSILKVRY